MGDEKEREITLVTKGDVFKIARILFVGVLEGTGRAHNSFRDWKNIGKSKQIIKVVEIMELKEKKTTRTC